MSRALSSFLLSLVAAYPTIACAPCPPQGKFVANADQSVVIVWDPAAKRQHFIRQASFASEAEDFGFVIPSPSRPELAESGNDAFAYLQELTAPRVVYRRNQGGGCSLGCSAGKVASERAAVTPEVRVLEEKLVAGFSATVLEADNSEVLARWLQEHGYAFSPAIAEWAVPYIEEKWKFTALKVAKQEGAEEDATVAASALRLSFDTDRPLFPYREPDYAKLAAGTPQEGAELADKSRLLRIYFLSSARYQGELTPDQPWTGEVAWAGALADDQRKQVLAALELPEETGPAKFYLTEFEDLWPYNVAPADVYFAQAEVQDDVRRPDVYVRLEATPDVLLGTLAILACTPWLWRRKVRATK
jgi:hypothetical protein